MYAPPAFGNGLFQAHPSAVIRQPPLGQPQTSPAAPAPASDRTGTELITVLVLGAAVLAALEVAGVTNILGRKPPKKGRSVWSPR